MKLLFFNRFFFPDTSATSQIVTDLASHLAAQGLEVHAVTSRAPGSMASEMAVGVQVHRVAGSITGHHGLLRRGIDYFDYYRGARRAARELIEPGDIVIVKTDPPMLSAAISALARRRGARLVVWLQDVFPEVAREYGVPGMSGPLGAILQRVRDASLRDADRVVVIGERMAERVVGAGVPRDRVEVIHNWADGAAIRPVPRATNALRLEWGLGDAFVVGYSGNLGRVHEFETLLGAAAMLKDDAGIRFVVIGRGPRLQEVVARVGREGLGNVQFRSHQSRDALSQSLGVADVHLSVLQPRFEGLVHPSKLYGIMAAGRPTIFIGDAAGETAAILSATQSGVAVKCGDAQGLADVIRSMRSKTGATEAMGAAARRAFDERYDMPIAVERWRSMLASLGYKSS